MFKQPIYEHVHLWLIPYTDRGHINHNADMLFKYSASVLLVIFLNVHSSYLVYNISDAV